MRRFSFSIDLTQGGGRSEGSRRREAPPPAADDFEMSADLAMRRQALRDWPNFQRRLERLPDLEDTVEPWDDPHLGAEYVRVYQVSKEKVLAAEPGFDRAGSLETHCFFSADGTKHLVSRLLSRPDERINEIRLTQEGRLIRLYYENGGGPSQELEDLFQAGLLGLEEDVGRFSRYPHYVMRFFLLTPRGDALDSSFRGVCYYDERQGEVVVEEARTV